MCFERGIVLRIWNPIIGTFVLMSAVRGGDTCLQAFPCFVRGNQTCACDIQCTYRPMLETVVHVHSLSAVALSNPASAISPNDVLQQVWLAASTGQLNRSL
eukprot:jgi/Botrbrau1/17688/Bobra.0166s0112.1